MRSKEEAHDYRYFPDPDLLPLVLHPDDVTALASKLPELPMRRRPASSKPMASAPMTPACWWPSRLTAAYFEQVAAGATARPPPISVINELFGRLNKDGKDVTTSPVLAAQVAAIVDLVSDGRDLSSKIAKDLFEIVYTEGGDPRVLVEERGLKQVTDTGAIEKVVDDIIAANPDKVAQVLAKPNHAGWFVGQAMKASGGKANPQALNEILKRKLGI